MANVYRCSRDNRAKQEEEIRTRGTGRRERGVGTMVEEKIDWEGKKKEAKKKESKKKAAR